MLKKAFTIAIVFLLIIPFCFALTTIEVNEGELIKLKLKATDADGDPIDYEFSAPLNKKGEWQTGFNDAGEYQSYVTVIDDRGGKATEKIKILVKNVNRPPDIKKYSQIEVQEMDFIDLKLPKKDIDGDAISYKISSPLDEEGKWQTGYKDAGEYKIKLTASDGKLKETQTIILVVRDLDRRAEFNNIVKNVSEGESVAIKFSKEDPDGDEITYDSSGLVFDSKLLNNEFTWAPDFDVIQPDQSWINKKLFKLGIGNTNKEERRKFIIPIVAKTDKSVDNFNITLFVSNTNRAPIIDSVEDIEIYETEEFHMTPTVHDPDGDPVVVSFSGSLNTNKFQTDYDDAGKYKITVTASDGDLSVSTDVSVVVLNTNRFPYLAVDKVTIREGEKSIIPINTADLDEEEIMIVQKRLPLTARFEEDSIIFRPDFGFVEHSDENSKGFVKKIMNKYFGFKQYNKETFATFDLDDGIDIIEKDLIIDVRDVNRKPVVEPVEKQTVREGQLLYIPLKGYDPDGDELKYRFKGLIKKNNDVVGYNKAGMHNLTIIVTDGKANEALVVPIEVIDTNRPPVLNLRKATVKEGETVYIQLQGKDPDKHNITYSLISAPAGAEIVNNSVLKYTPIYDAVKHYIADENNTQIRNPIDYNEFLFKISASDEEYNVVVDTVVRVKDVDREPEIITYSPAERFKIKKGQKIEFFVNAVDPDGDELTYKWKSSKFSSIEDDNRHTRKLLQTGLREFNVIVSDGDKEVEHQWLFIVK